MSKAPENSTVHPDDLLLFPLISAEFDGELTPAELADLRLLEQRLPDRASALRDQCARLREHLQQLPVVPAQLRTTVSGISRPRKTRRGVLRATSLVATCLTCGLAILLFFRPLSSVKTTEGISSFRADSAPSGAAAPAGPAEAAAAASRFASDIGSVPFPSTAPGGPAPAPAPAGAEVTEITGQPRLLLKESDWQVVVVKVRQGSPEDVLKELRQVLSRHGLQLARSQPSSMPDWLGVYLPASIPHRENLLTEVQRGLATEAPEWDPAEIMRSSRESILRAVRQSLSSPSRHELAGGEVLVAVSSATEKAATDQPAMLVVFEFSQEDGAGGLRQIF